MSELSERVLKEFKDNITISKLKEECIMQRKTRKQVLFGTILCTLMLSGSFITVNAATNGQLVENIKDTIKVVFVKDGNEQEIDGKIHTDENGEYWITFEKSLNDAQMQVDLKPDKLDKENIKVETKMTEIQDVNSSEGEISINIVNK